MSKARTSTQDLLNVDADFERLHPRGKGGRFVEVALRLQAMGAKWEVPGVRRHEGAEQGIKSLDGQADEERGIWLVPTERRGELDALMEEAGYSVIDVPAGMRPARPEDREKFKWPPAWTDVFVAEDPKKADVLVKGRDSVGRGQRIYSDRYHFHQNEKKFARVRALEAEWTEVSRKMEDDATTDPTAAALMLTARMGFRPGSTRDTKAKKQAYGSSTIERRHVKVTGDTVRVRMVTKGGRKTDLSIVDPALARVMERYSKGKTGKDRLFDTNENRMLDWMRENAGEVPAAPAESDFARVVAPEAFQGPFQKALEGDGGAWLTDYSLAERQEQTLLLSRDGRSGAAVKPDGDIVSVFRLPYGEKGSGRKMLREAVAHGGTKLDAIGDGLRKLYEDEGFEITESVDWDDQYAPDDWDYDANGRPRIYFMAYAGGRDERPTPRAPDALREAGDTGTGADARAGVERRGGVAGLPGQDVPGLGRAAEPGRDQGPAATAVEGFKTKDLRTRFGTAHARAIVSELPLPTDRKEYQRQRNFVGDQVAERLGNTRKMALSSYIDRAVFMEWENSDTVEPKAAKELLGYFDNLDDRRREIARFGLDDWPTKGEASNEILGDAPDTQTLHSVGRTESGAAIYKPERKALHDQWVGEEIAKPLREALGGVDDPAVDRLARGETLTLEETLDLRERIKAGRVGDKPVALFMAGGPASGKTSSLRNEPDLKPPAAVEINADDLKEKLPEYERIRKRRDKWAAAAAHEESSDLAKRLQQEALALGLNVVIDGTGNGRAPNPETGDAGKFLPKVTDMVDADYTVDMLYVTIPTEEAVVRATLRAMGEGRWVPTPELRKSHRLVSENFLEILELDGVRDLKLYENNQASGDPRKIAEYIGGKLVIYDQVAYDSYIDKMNEKG